MSEKLLEDKLDNLEQLQDLHLDKAKQMMQADNSSLFPLDLLAVSVFKRSMSLISGFCLLVRNKNYICAAPLVRLQLDNALRFFATTLVKEPHKVAADFIGGSPIRDFKDYKTGHKLTDSYLVTKICALGKEFEWIERLYKNSSGYIHLSEKHFYNSTGLKGDEPMKFTSVIGADDKFITTKDRLDAVNSMIEVTNVVLLLLDGWTFNKNNPGIREKLEMIKNESNTEKFKKRE